MRFYLHSSLRCTHLHFHFNSVCARGSGGIKHWQAFLLGRSRHDRASEWCNILDLHNVYCVCCISNGEFIDDGDNIHFKIVTSRSSINTLRMVKFNTDGVHIRDDSSCGLTCRKDSQSKNEKYSFVCVLTAVC